MTTSRWYAASLIAAALVVFTGCDDKKPDQPKVDSNTPAPKVETKVNDATKSITDSVKTGADAAKTEAGKIADPSKLTLDPVKAAAADATKTVTDPTKTATATDAAKTTASAAVPAEAKDWMTKLGDAVKANKLDEAKTYLDKLDAIKANLPADMAAQLDTLRKGYEAAKLKGGLPGLSK